MVRGSADFRFLKPSKFIRSCKTIGKMLTGDRNAAWLSPAPTLLKVEVLPGHIFHSLHAHRKSFSGFTGKGKTRKNL
jgi:hypothetical protein